MLTPSVSVQNSILVILIILVIPATRNSRHASAALQTAYSLFMRRISCALSAMVCPLSPLSLDGTSFNIQNPIPHPSQKEKVLLETRRAKECQRGIAGAAERAKKGGRVPAEGSDTRLGPHSQTFEPHTPDQTLPNRAKEHQTSAKSSGLSLPFFSISCNPKCGNIPKTPTA